MKKTAEENQYCITKKSTNLMVIDIYVYNNTITESN